MLNLDNLDLGGNTDGAVSGFGSADELLKAMEAGLGTGRDYTDQLNNGTGLKVESLYLIVKE